MVTIKLNTQKGIKRVNNRPKTASRKPRKRKQARRIRLSPWIVAAALLFLAAIVLFPYYRNGKFARTGAVVPSDARQFCLDISHYNEGIVWDSLMVVIDNHGRTSKDLLKAKRVYPLSRIVIKATEGERMKDGKFSSYWEEAGKRGYVRGAYHFFRSSKDPAKQAANYIGTVKLRHSDLPPVLDVETMHVGCTREELNRNVLAWLKAVEKHYGRTPIVYTSDSYARDILSAEITGHYPIWIARYNAEPPRFSPWTMWQFTDKAVLYGVSGYVDLSVIQ